MYSGELKVIPARVLWLYARCRYIQELAKEGETFEQIMQVLNCDPGQVQLLSMTDPESVLDPWLRRAPQPAGSIIDPK